MNSTNSGLETTITSTTEKNLLNTKMIDGIDDVMSLKDEEVYRLVFKRQ